MAYLQKPTLMSATPCYNPDTSNTGSGFEQVFDKRHGGCPTQELHAQIRKVSLWIFPARLLMRPGACSPPSCAHLCISVLCADWSLLVTSCHFLAIFKNFHMPRSSCSFCPVVRDLQFRLVLDQFWMSPSTQSPPGGSGRSEFLGLRSWKRSSRTRKQNADYAGKLP